MYKQGCPCLIFRCLPTSADFPTHLILELWRYADLSLLIRPSMERSRRYQWAGLR
jgi:hypothetical protein